MASADEVVWAKRQTGTAERSRREKRQRRGMTG
jgi:hypothetical protein